jgi:hypothetical protein
MVCQQASPFSRKSFDGGDSGEFRDSQRDIEMLTRIGQLEQVEFRASSYVIFAENPEPPTILCTWPAMAPGLTMGSRRSRTMRPGQFMEKKASMDVARARARMRMVGQDMTAQWGKEEDEGYRMGVREKDVVRNEEKSCYESIVETTRLRLNTYSSSLQQRQR